jgi:tRNA(Ile)-lysidine synthase
MINIQGKLPRTITVACSGGVDSMAAVNFLSQNHNVNLMFYDHGTETSRDAKEFLLEEFPPNNDRNIALYIATTQGKKQKRESWEEYWRNQRYGWFHSLNTEIITCHHLDDCVENWIFSCLNGEGKIIPYRNRNVIRPFRLNKKTEFSNWCMRKDVKWIEDLSNEDTGYMRNFIRHELLPKALVVNPGLDKVIRKKVAADEII